MPLRAMKRGGPGSSTMQSIDFIRRGDGATGCDNRLTVVTAPEIEMESYLWEKNFFKKTVREGTGGRFFLLVLLMVMNIGS